jgi:hypothetical protein
MTPVEWPNSSLAGQAFAARKQEAVAIQGKAAGTLTR